MAEGHAWLFETFGVRPTVGWQLDPFGHSAASAALLGRMGLDSLVINRINYNLKYRWRSARHMEFGGGTEARRPPVGRALDPRAAHALFVAKGPRL